MKPVHERKQVEKVEDCERQLQQQQPGESTLYCDKLNLERQLLLLPGNNDAVDSCKRNVCVCVCARACVFVFVCSFVCVVAMDTREAAAKLVVAKMTECQKATAIFWWFELI